MKFEESYVTDRCVKRYIYKIELVIYKFTLSPYELEHDSRRDAQQPGPNRREKCSCFESEFEH